MEDTLRGVMKLIKKIQHLSLNPCFNGRYSQRMDANLAKMMDQLS